MTIVIANGEELGGVKRVLSGIAAAICTFGLVVSIAIAAYGAIIERRFATEGERAVAAISGKEHVDRRAVSYIVTYEFKTSAGAAARAVNCVQRPSFERLAVGSLVEIIYLKSDPQTARLVRESSCFSFRDTVLFAVFAIPLLTASVYIGVRGVRAPHTILGRDATR